VWPGLENIPDNLVINTNHFYVESGAFTEAQLDFIKANADFVSTVRIIAPASITGALLEQLVASIDGGMFHIPASDYTPYIVERNAETGRLKRLAKGTQVFYGS